MGLLLFCDRVYMFLVKCLSNSNRPFVSLISTQLTKIIPLHKKLLNRKKLVSFCFKKIVVSILDAPSW
jgi:hypothetical protein